MGRRVAAPPNSRHLDLGPGHALDDERDRGDEERSPSAPPKPDYQTVERTWLSPDDDDPERDEAAERARKAVEPGRPGE